MLPVLKEYLRKSQHIRWTDQHAVLCGMDRAMSV